MILAAKCLEYPFLLFHIYRQREDEQIAFACSSLLEQIASNQEGEGKNLKYDVFISYSHRNQTQANTVRETLQNQDKDLKVFFDSEELKTGTLTISLSLSPLFKRITIVFHSFKSQTELKDIYLMYFDESEASGLVLVIKIQYWPDVRCQ